jgi:hypothetical protein
MTPIESARSLERLIGAPIWAVSVYPLSRNGVVSLVVSIDQRYAVGKQGLPKTFDGYSVVLEEMSPGIALFSGNC